MQNQLPEEPEKNKKRAAILKKFLTPKCIAVIAIILILCAIILGLSREISFDNKTTKIGFEDIGELVTQSAYCTEVNVTDASRELFGIEIPFTQSKYIYSYDIIIKAGFDFTEITWTENNNVIEIQLPEAEILSSEVDMDSFKLYHEKESIYRPITMEENNEALKSLELAAQENAIANGLLDNARANAEVILTGFFSATYSPDIYTLKFTDK